MSSPEKLETKIETSEVGSKRCTGNEVTLTKPKFLKCSSVSGLRDADIPEMVLVEVLIRLPVKFVFRFKLVSKQWLSIISDPYFFRAYVSRVSLLLQQPWTILSYNTYQHGHEHSQVLDFGMLEDMHLKPSRSVVPVLSIHPPQEGDYMILGVSSGLVLYGSLEQYGSRSYNILNPLTAQCIALPRLACEFIMPGWGFLTHVEDGFLKSYRVVGVMRPNRGSNSIIFRVFVSEIGEWKDFTLSCKIFPLFLKRAATDLNGILHWIAGGHGIIAYDPYQNPKHMRIIAFPGDINLEREEEFYSLCVAYQGKLRYFEIAGSIMSGNAFLSLRVWVIDDYNSGDWCLQHNISYADARYDGINFPSGRSTLVPICFHPFDSDIVYLGCDADCVSYNIKNRKLQFEQEFFMHTGNIFKETHGFWWWASTFLFVIPPWPISIPRPSPVAMEG